jgi:hypothetical protein
MRKKNRDKDVVTVGVLREVLDERFTKLENRMDRKLNERITAAENKLTNRFETILKDQLGEHHPIGRVPGRFLRVGRRPGVVFIKGV